MCCSPTTDGASSYGANGEDVIYKILIPDVFEAPALDDFTARTGLTVKESRHAARSSFQEVSNNLKIRYVCDKQDGRVLGVKVAPGEISVVGHVGGSRKSACGAFIPQSYIVGLINSQGYHTRPNPGNAHIW